MFLIADNSFKRRFQKWIHVKLPKVEAIEQQLSNLLANHRNCVFKFEIAQLARQLRGYSPFDIDTLINFVIEEKYAQLKKATHFAKDPHGFFYMCSSDEKGAMQCKFKDIRMKNYHYPIVTFNDLLFAKKNTPPTNCIADEQRFVDFGKDYNK